MTVTWTAPSLNTDGSALTNASGYRVDFGTSTASLGQSVAVQGATTTSTSIGGLSAGTYYFAVTTLNASGVASTRSSTVSRTVP